MGDGLKMVAFTVGAGAAALGGGVAAFKLQHHGAEGVRREQEHIDTNVSEHRAKGLNAEADRLAGERPSDTARNWSRVGALAGASGVMGAGGALTAVIGFATLGDLQGKAARVPSAAIVGGILTAIAGAGVMGGAFTGALKHD